MSAGTDREPISPEAGVEFSRTMWEQDGCSKGLGMEATTIEPGHAVVSMTVRDDMVNGHDICHGGLIFTLADSCFALACNTVGRTTVAAGADVTFVSAARLGETLVAEGRVRASYGRSGLTDVSVHAVPESDESGEPVRLVAEFRGRSRTIG